MTGKHPLCLWISATVLAFWGARAIGQTFDEPDEILPVRRQVERFEPVDEPDADAAAEVWLEQTAGVEAAAAPRRLAEGSFIVKQRGRVVATDSGHRVFVASPTGEGADMPPMLLLPGQVLWRLDALLDAEPQTPIVLTGRVTSYGGQNFVMPTAFARAQPSSVATADAQPTSVPREPASGVGSLPGDPSIDELMGDLDRDPVVRGIATGSDRVRAMSGAGASGGDGSTPAARAMTDKPIAPPVPDGTALVRRRGRLARLPDGAWAVFFDNDHDTGGDGLDRPLTVLPCRMLADIQQRAARFGDSMELLISGRVFSYGQRSYLLPTIFQRPSKIGIDPVQ